MRLIGIGEAFTMILNSDPRSIAGIEGGRI